MIKLDKEINQTASADYLRYQFDLGLHSLRRYLVGWMACDVKMHFNSISVISGRSGVIMKRCLQWNPVYD